MARKRRLATHGLTHIALAVKSPYAYVRDPDGYEIEIWYE